MTKKNQITKKQHFVQQQYLKNWSRGNDNKVFYVDRERNISGFYSPKNILAENYIYELPVLSKEEIIDIQEFFISMKLSDNEKVSVFIDMLYSLSLIDKVLKEDDYVNKFEKIKKEGFETFHSKIEEYGRDLISVQSKKDLIELLKSDNLKIVIFILIQNFRTQGLKNRLYEVLKNESEGIIRAKGVLTPILLAIKIANNKVASFKLLINNTDDIFITSGQPVINISEDLDDEGNYKDFLLYYPINPNLGLEISFNEQEMYIESKDCTVRDVYFYNNFMFKNNLIISNKEFQVKVF